MKKIVYSGFFKFIAVLLLIASIVLGVLVTTNGIITFFSEENDIYSFESNFSDSWYIYHLLNEPENAVYNAYYSIYGGNDEEQTTTDVPSKDPVDSQTVVENIKKRLENLHCADEIDYYIKINDTVMTNCQATDAEDLMQGEYYSYVERDGTGAVKRESTAIRADVLTEDISRFDTDSIIVICCSIKAEAINTYKAIWDKQEGIVIDTAAQAFCCAIMALLLFIYLISVCGKNVHGEYQNMWIDNIWLEIQLVIMGAAGGGAVALYAYVLDEYMSGYFPQKFVNWVIGVATALGSTVILTVLLSMIRNVKTRRLLETSVIFRVLRWMIRILVTVLTWICKLIKVCLSAMIGLLSKKTGVLLVAVLFLYTAAIGLLGIGTVISPICLLAGVLLFAVACIFVAYRAKELEQIKKGAREVRGGNVSYKIPDLKCRDMKALAENVNDIAQGLDQSVSAQVKAERLKTELITNVSHDLKTPITSIINYAELLSKTDDLSEEARGYVAVIEKKSLRLKKLIQDLFDISKVQSGNDEVVSEKLDVALLINQALGEHDHEISASDLPFCVQVDKELYISADGRKMSRVVSNLIDNILKYSMKNTRVFITASEKDGMIQLEFKNISAYPLNFDVEEITQRFVRGDESRTEEGNGLGLAIAKSYTEVCNGVFEIVADGDMFKVILKFKRYG